MASELITGFAGKPHVGSDDMGAFQAGILGTGSYVLQTGQQLKATVASANKVTIGTGDLVMNGRHVRMATTTDLTIQNGSQGKKRNDLIVCRYQKASDGKETATLTVVKGTATSGTPADPSTNKTSILDGASVSDMPLYRIPITNLSVGTPVQLFKVLTPLDTVGDSVTQSGWQSVEMLSGFTAAQGWGVRGLMIKRVGNLVSLYGMVRRTGGWEDGYQVARIPEGMRPSYRVCAPTLYLNEGLSSIGEQSDTPDMSILRLGYTHYGDGAQATLISMMWML